MLKKDLSEFEQDLLESVRQAKAGEFVAVHTPEAITKRGRPAGSKAAITKEAVKIRLDPDVLAALRATGKGWQTRINDVLRERFVHRN